jgi:hypothetical protein
MTLVSDAIGAAFTGRKAITPWAAIRRIVDSQNQSTFADTRKDSRMGWLADLTDASVQDADHEGRPIAEPLSRQPIGIMGVAMGVFLGNLFTGILASVLYYLITTEAL